MEESCWAVCLVFLQYTKYIMTGKGKVKPLGTGQRLRSWCFYRVSYRVIVYPIFTSGRDLPKWLERLTADADVATVLGWIPASSDAVESKGRQMKQCWMQYIEAEKIKKIPLFIFTKGTVEAVMKESRSERHLPATFGTWGPGTSQRGLRSQVYGWLFTDLQSINYL